MKPTMDEPRQTNTPEFSVSDIAGAIRRTLEGAFGRVRVRGEITELKRYPSGHIYLSLKDENAKLAGVIWRGSVSRIGLQPENGVEVIATGKLTTYADRSSYQLQIDRLEYAGAGALLARIEAVRLKLLEEGLFAPERKRALPMLPRVIGVVSSEKGAVIQDIRTTIARRFPRSVILWPVPVQGEGAAEKIAAAIDGFAALAQDDPLRPDVLIVARGGGSLEDLMAFNDEAVVRAAAACTIPLISAVGHETDTTLIDFAADRRAPTPTAAAEMAIPARADLLAQLAQMQARLLSATQRGLNERRLTLAQVERRLPDLPALLRETRQRLDDRGERLRLALPNLLAARRATLDRLTARLPHPRERLAAQRAGLALAGTRLNAVLAHTITTQKGRAGRVLARLSDVPVRAQLREAAQRLQGVAARLESVSYERVLTRGFALVSDAAGHAVTSAAQVQAGAHLSLRFADGQRQVVAQNGDASPSPKKRISPGKPKPRQDSLL